MHRLRSVLKSIPTNFRYKNLPYYKAEKIAISAQIFDLHSQKKLHPYKLKSHTQATNQVKNPYSLAEKPLQSVHYTIAASKSSEIISRPFLTAKLAPFPHNKKHPLQKTLKTISCIHCLRFLFTEHYSIQIKFNTFSQENFPHNNYSKALLRSQFNVKALYCNHCLVLLKLSQHQKAPNSITDQISASKPATFRRRKTKPLYKNLKYQNMHSLLSVQNPESTIHSLKSSIF